MSRIGKGTVPEEPDMRLNEGVVADRVLNAYQKASARLTALGISHAVVGGLAVGAWGRPRATDDVDFLVRESDVFDGKAFLTFKRGVPIEVDGVTIDYLTVESLKLRGRRTRVVGEVVPIELLIAMKLKAKRMQDDADIVALLKGGADLVDIELWLQMHGTPEWHRRFVKLLRVARGEK